MSDVDEKRLELAREIANEMEELARQKVFAVIALFSGNKKDLDIANGGTPIGKVVYIRILLALEKEKEAIDVVRGLSATDQEKERSEAETAIVCFFVNKNRIEEAFDRIQFIFDVGWKAHALRVIADAQRRVIIKMEEENKGLRQKTVPAEVNSVAVNKL